MPQHLTEWIAGEHLTAAALARAREVFLDSPARAVCLPHFLVAAVAESLARFLASDASFGTGYGLKSRYGFASKADFECAPAEERFFRYQGIRHVARESPDFETFQTMTRTLGDSAARRFFEEISSQPLGGVTLSARRMGHEDFMVRHNDAIGGRRLSFVMYLTPGWDPAYGGSLGLEHGDGQVTTVVPEYNTLVVFDAETWHWVEPFAPALQERARLTIGGWFLKPDGTVRPVGLSGSTVGVTTLG